MKLSIICSSRRPYLWQDVHKQIHSEKINYELIFIGPFKPRFKLPTNCRFIHSIVKPAQCFEIGCRSSVGDFLALFTDDIKIKKGNLLEKFTLFYQKQKNDLFLFSHQLYSYGDKIVVPNSEYNNLTIPFAPFFSKRVFKIVGGVDANYIAVLHDADLYLRMMKFGCKVYFSGLTFVEKERSIYEPTLYGDFAGVDKKYFNKKWKKNNQFDFDSKKKIKKFNSTNLISVSQGPKGKWKYRSFFLFFLMQSNIKNRILKILRLDFPFFHRIYLLNKNNFLIKKLSRIIKYLFY